MKSIMNPDYVYLCQMGQPHNWVTTGNGFLMWTSTVTGSAPPSNAPFVAEEQCKVCGAVRYVPSTMETQQ